MRANTDRRLGTSVWPIWSRARCARFSAKRKLSRTRCAPIWRTATPNSNRRWPRFCTIPIEDAGSSGDVAAGTRGDASLGAFLGFLDSFKERSLLGGQVRLRGRSGYTCRHDRGVLVPSPMGHRDDVIERASEPTLDAEWGGEDHGASQTPSFSAISVDQSNSLPAARHYPRAAVWLSWHFSALVQPVPGPVTIGIFVALQPLHRRGGHRCKMAKPVTHSIAVQHSGR